MKVFLLAYLSLAVVTVVAGLIAVAWDDAKARKEGLLDEHGWLPPDPADEKVVAVVTANSAGLHVEAIDRPTALEAFLRADLALPVSHP